MRLNFYNLFTLVQPTTVTLYNPYVPVNTHSPQQLHYITHTFQSIPTAHNSYAIIRHVPVNTYSPQQLHYKTDTFQSIPTAHNS